MPNVNFLAIWGWGGKKCVAVVGIWILIPTFVVENWLLVVNV